MAQSQAVQGYTGSVSAKVGAGTDTVVIDMKNWNLNIQTDMIDVSAMGSGWKQSIPGLKGWSGDFDGNWNMGSIATPTQQKVLHDAMLGGSYVTMRFHIKDTVYYEGSGYLQTVNPAAAVNGAATIKFQLQGDGELTFTNV